MVDKTEPEHFTVKSAAEFLACDPWTIRRAIARGDIKAYRLKNTKVIRIRRRDLERAMRPVTPVAANLGDDDAQA